MSSNNGRPARRKVVVTGLGAVSPNGIGVNAFWNATRNGISGVATITSFDPEPLSSRIAGEVKNFCAEDYLSPNELKRTGRSIPFAIAAAREALEAAKISVAELSLDEQRSWEIGRAHV